MKLAQEQRRASSTISKDNLKGRFHELTLPLQEPFLDTSNKALQVNIPLQNITNLSPKPQPTQLMPPYLFDAMDYFHNAPSPLFISGGKEAQPSLKPLLNFTLDPETIFNKGPKLLNVSLKIKAVNLVKYTKRNKKTSDAGVSFSVAQMQLRTSKDTEESIKNVFEEHQPMDNTLMLKKVSQLFEEE